MAKQHNTLYCKIVGRLSVSGTMLRSFFLTARLPGLGWV